MRRSRQPQVASIADRNSLMFGSRKALKCCAVALLFGPSSFRVERNSHMPGLVRDRGTVCGRVKAGRRPPEGLGLDAVAQRETLAKGLSVNAFLAGNPDGRG